MANFAILIDPDPDRRLRFIERVTPLLPLTEGLVTADCASGDAHAVWATTSHAPVSSQADAAGLGVLWGDAFGERGRMDAADLRRRSQDTPTSRPPFDGFHAAVTWDHRAGLAASGDVLGLFPLYYWSARDVLLVASSPEAFRHHPEFQSAVDLEGLVGLLLFSHLLDGHSLLQGVRRLGAGRILRWRPGARADEGVQYELPISTRYYDRPFAAHLDLLDEALDAALTRQTADKRPVGLLLSGGLDSRLLGGVLHRRGASVTALTLGLPNDIEMKCAVLVARTLGFGHLTGESNRTFACVNLTVRGEHLAGGFHGLWQWAPLPLIRQLPTHVVTGRALDSVAGGIAVDYCFDGAENALTFERCFAWLNGWGIAPERLGQLLRGGRLGEILADRLEWIRRAYRAAGDNEMQRAWRFYMAHRARFHLGSRAWLHSFASWPVLPILDQGLLDLAAGIPAASVGERRLQKELLCTRFPALAELPLDRNAWDTETLRPRLRHQIGQALAARLPAALTARRAAARSKAERRRYYRLYDINDDAWLAVRRAAEAGRSNGARFFEPAALAEMLPPPEAVIGPQSNAASAGQKTLMGLLLWLDGHA